MKETRTEPLRNPWYVCNTPCMDTPSDLIGSAETCQMLGISAMTLSRWVAAGRILPATQLPGKNGARLFRRVDVEPLAAQLPNVPESA